MRLVSKLSSCSPNRWPWIRAFVALVLSALITSGHAVEIRQLTVTEPHPELGPGFGPLFPTWSPDGTHIAVHWTGVTYEPRWGGYYEAWSHIIVFRTSDGLEVDPPERCNTIGHGPLMTCPAWSPRGDQIAYLCDNEVWLGSVTGSTSQALPDIQACELTWSPDGNHIAFEGANGIHVVPVAGGDPVRLTTGPDRNPAWSADGKRIAFDSTRNGSSDIWVVDATGGEPWTLTTGPEGDVHPTWSPNGALVAFSSHRDGNTDIWVVRVANGALSRVTQDPSWDITPEWSRDGRSIVFTSGRTGNQNIFIATDLQTLDVEPKSWSDVKRRFR